MRRLKNWLISKAYPMYDCECCVGQDWWQGCYCHYHGAVAPCEGPTRRHEFLRRVAALLFKYRE